ncbi:MAG TPA: metallophosphoesterase [Opitutaceae bacterium]|nr:metallophosphoesterase [Opitutaceae bacterium]
MHRTNLLLALLLASAAPLSATAERPLVPLPVPGTGQWSAGAAGDHFEFVVAGDNRAAARDLPPPPTAGEIFREVRLLRPSFCLWTGDTIYGSDDTVGEAEQEYDAFLNSAAAAATPIFNAPGNHEIFKRADLERLYARRMGPLFGSFDAGRSHFIALDTEELGRPPGIGDAQRAWLEHDLEQNRGAAHIFVFMHHPLFPKDKTDGFGNRANRDAIHRLFVQYHVAYVFSGHEHLYYASVHDGVHYVVTGGGGAPTDAAPEDGGFQNYVVVQVDGDRVTTTVLQPWRLFSSSGPVAPDNSTSTIVSNYNHDPVTVTVGFPAARPAGEMEATAAWTYKGKSHPIAATIVPAGQPGITAVQVTVPRDRAALVSLRAK